MDWKERLDKLLSREFLAPVIVGIIFTVAYFFAKREIDFESFAFWLTIVAGIPAGALTVQKVGKSLMRK